MNQTPVKQKLLIVDDESGIVDMMSAYFAPRYTVLAASSGTEALQKVSAGPDLILLDINMPDLDGLTVCRKIREYICCPILFLTARIESADQIEGFRAGADDYIVKPFDLDELGARVEAHLRREKRHQRSTAVRFFGELVIDYAARTVVADGEPILLSRREFDIVELLSVQGRFLTGNGSMKASGESTGMGTVIPSWSIPARSAQSSRCTQGINISRLSGGVAINGTADEMVEKNGA